MAGKRLTSEQRSALGDVRDRLRSEPDAGRPRYGDTVLRREIDEWITQILARSGRVCPEAEKRFGYVMQEAPRGGRALRYAHEVDAVLAQDAAGTRGSSRTVSLRQSLAAALVSFVLLVTLQRFAFHRTWPDAAATATAAAFSVAWVVCQAIVRWLAARRQRRSG